MSNERIEDIVSGGYLIVKSPEKILQLEEKLTGRVVKSFSQHANIHYEFTKFAQSPAPQISSNVKPIMIVPSEEVSSITEVKIDIEAIPCELVLYFPVIHSTQTLLQDLQSQVSDVTNAGLCIISHVQVCGRGRKEGRSWHSPIGCAMFSFNGSISNSAAFLNRGIFTQRIGFVQHLACLSIIKAIDYLFTAQNATSVLKDFKIKWPNDVYYKDKKIAGLIMRATHDSACNCFEAIIGIGINVSNEEPTDCLNAILERDAGIPRNKVTIEQVIGRVIKEFNDILLLITKYPDSFDFVKKQYEERWMHTNQIVTVPNFGEMKILGVDGCGYLLAEKVCDNTTVLLGPEMDGVTLDLPV